MTSSSSTTASGDAVQSSEGVSEDESTVEKFVDVIPIPLPLAPPVLSTNGSTEPPIHSTNGSTEPVLRISSGSPEPALLLTDGPTAVKQQGVKRKRNLPGTPAPDAEVVALSPTTLMATHKFTCEVCGRGFQREQNLQLHKRGHNLPGSLKPRANKDKEVRKKVYVCPEPACVHHDPARALGDLTGIKKHFCRKHGEKKWKCEKCCKKYAVLSDWKAHSKTCGTRDYKCECGSIFYRRDSFVTHKAFCDELAEESARLAAGGSDPQLPVSLLEPFLPVSGPENENEPVSYTQLLGEDEQAST